MSEDRRKLVASPKAVRRAQQLGPGSAALVERVGEVITGQFVTAQVPRRDASRPRIGPEGVPEIGLHPTGELEPSVKQTLVDTVSKIFGDALKVKLGRVRKVVDEIDRKAAQDTSTTGPTKRRAEMAAQGHGIRRPKSPDKPHKVRGTLDVFGVHFTAAERVIFQRFVRDAELATAMNITARYEVMSGGASTPRSSHITEAQRAAYARFYYVWRKLGPQFQTICGAAVLEVRSETMGRAFTLEEIGQQATNYTDRALCRSAALGLTKATLWRLAELYLEWDGLDEQAQRVLREAHDEIQSARMERLGRAEKASEARPPQPRINPAGAQ